MERLSVPRPLDADGRPAPDPPADAPIRTCPNCGRELLERKCKLYCPDTRCGYFLSCSDYY